MMSKEGRIRVGKPCSAAYFTDPEQSWFVKINGRTTRGKADNREDAIRICEKIYSDYVLSQWAKGNSLAGGRWICPLK